LLLVAFGCFCQPASQSASQPASQLGSASRSALSITCGTFARFGFCSTSSVGGLSSCATTGATFAALALAAAPNAMAAEVFDALESVLTSVSLVHGIGSASSGGSNDEGWLRVEPTATLGLGCADEEVSKNTLQRDRSLQACLRWDC
jgi:hypothetical protein